jgi:DNA-binding NarL/FixJ family response regulator
MRIMLVDHHPRHRQSLRKLLESDQGVRVVGEAGNGTEALHLAEEVRPDIIIMDISLPGRPALETAKQVKRIFPKVKVVVLSNYAHQLYLNYAFHCGASGYVHKGSASLIKELVKALKAVTRGQDYISPSLQVPLQA